MAVMGRLMRHVAEPATTFHTPSGPELTAAGWVIGASDTVEGKAPGVVPATVVVCPAGTPPRTGWPLRPGAGVPVAPMAGRVPCCTVEFCTGCNVCG